MTIAALLVFFALLAAWVAVPAERRRRGSLVQLPGVKAPAKAA